MAVIALDQADAFKLDSNKYLNGKPEHQAFKSKTQETGMN